MSIPISKLPDSFSIDGLPYPPSENAIYTPMIMPRRPHPYATIVLSKEGRSYKQTVANHLNHSGMTTALREFIEHHGEVYVSIFLKSPEWYTKSGNINKRAGDCANRVKILQDVIFEACGIDDCHAFYTGAYKRFGESHSADVVISRMHDVWDHL